MSSKQSSPTCACSAQKLQRRTASHLRTRALRCQRDKINCKGRATTLSFSLLAWFLVLGIGPRFSSDPAVDGPQLSILSANLTSMRKIFPFIQEIDASYSFLRETTLNSQGQSSMRKSLHKSGYDVHFGLPCGFELSGKEQKHSLWNATSGGLATVAKQPLPREAITPTLPVCTCGSGRCTFTRIPTGIGTRGFYVFNVYGFVGAGPKNLKPKPLMKTFSIPSLMRLLRLATCLS